MFKGDPLRITDTFCTCHVGARAIGGCAHALAVLILIGQLLGIGIIEPREPTRSEEMLIRGPVLPRKGADGSNMNESDTNGRSDSEADSTEESDNSCGHRRDLQHCFKFLTT